MLSILSFLWSGLSAQQLLDRQDRFDACLTAHGSLQEQLRSARDQYMNALSDVRAEVDRLIARYSVVRVGHVLQVENLLAAVELSMHLRDQNAECDSNYFLFREKLLNEAWAEGICTEELNYDQYQELFDNYLEDAVLHPVEHYASTYFASQLGFRSMLQLQLQAEEEWLARQGLDWRAPHPFEDLPIKEEMYWSVLNGDWMIDFRHPEPQLESMQVASKMKFKELLISIFDNWDEIKDLLTWLEELVLTDCSPTVTARINSDTRDVNLMQELSPEIERRIYYQVGQRGVRADFRSTRTRIWGKAKLYKRKRNRFVRDKMQVVGIAYCTQQWNVCDDRPWPANRQPFQFAGVHRRGKAKFSERHPYTLAIQDLNTEFINFPLFYNRCLVDQIHLLGNGGCF
ncbi:MAG: hypothetical protein FJX92_04890 [Bacteroidetes bacterium]|nr:hypothetical protein [Bacteroidota bacterium]